MVGFAVIKGSELSPITLPELTGVNAQATGGQRQICYELKAGEAGFILRPTSVLKF